MTGTFWAILPPVIAIVLALITKEVYLSLMIGIASGALMYHNFHLIKAMDTIFAIMGEKIGADRIPPRHPVGGREVVIVGVDGDAVRERFRQLRRKGGLPAAAAAIEGHEDGAGGGGR